MSSSSTNPESEAMHAHSEACGCVGHAECRTQRRSHAEGPILEQSYFFNPHLPKILPISSYEEVTISVTIMFIIHCSLLDIYSSKLNFKCNDTNLV